MALFYATCPAGLENLAAKLAPEALKRFRLEQVISGGLFFSVPERLPCLPYFQNCYLSLARYEGVTTMTQAVTRLLEDRGTLRQANQTIAAYGFSTFRVMFSEQNAPVAVDAGQRNRLERLIIAAETDRAHPQTELLILTRREGFALVLLRLSRAAGDVPKGALSPSLAALMVGLGRFGSGGIFLDPFAGSGALGKARLALGGAPRVILMDQDADKLASMRRSLRNAPQEKLTIRKGDALTLGDDWPDEPVQELVCDPPWGIFTPLPMPADAFHETLLTQFEKIMAPNGRLVILTADKKSLAAALEKSAFEPNARYDLLVHGKKAAIFAASKQEK